MPRPYTAPQKNVTTELLETQQQYLLIRNSAITLATDALQKF